jgi:hypothetical protein
MSQSFAQNVSTAPSLAVQNPIVRHPIEDFDKSLRARGERFSDRGCAVDWMSGTYYRRQILFCWEDSVGVEVEVIDDFAVGSCEFEDFVWCDGGV